MENILDIFGGDEFKVISMLDPVNKMPTNPGFLGSLGIFTAESVNTETVAVGLVNGRLDLIQTTLRAAPIEMATPQGKNIRDFRLPRLAKGDTLRASQLASIVPWPGQTRTDALATELAKKQQQLKQDVEYTKEFHRLGALQGHLLDANNSVIYDYFDEWDISEPTEIDLDLTTADDGDLRKELTGIHRTLIRASGAGQAVTRVIGLAGDTFYDELIANPEVRKTYLNQADARDLRGSDPFGTFRYGEIEWINYRGSDDNSTIGIDTNDAVIFPVGVPGMFRHVMGPGESFELVNQMGRDVYPLLVRDKDRDMWVQPEIYSYPLFLNTRPDLILRATVG